MDTIYSAYLLIATVSIAGWLLLAHVECHEDEGAEAEPLVSADCALLSRRQE